VLHRVKERLSNGRLSGAVPSPLSAANFTVTVGGHIVTLNSLTDQVLQVRSALTPTFVTTSTIRALAQTVVGRSLPAVFLRGGYWSRAWTSDGRRLLYREREGPCFPLRACAVEGKASELQWMMWCGVV
jgi:hypothetical protein